MPTAGTQVVMLADTAASFRVDFTPVTTWFVKMTVLNTFSTMSNGAKEISFYSPGMHQAALVHVCPPT